MGPQLCPVYSATRRELIRWCRIKSPRPRAFCRSNKKRLGSFSICSAFRIRPAPGGRGDGDAIGIGAGASAGSNSPWQRRG